MVNLKTLLLISTAIVMPTTAAADPITALFAGLGFTTATTAAVASALYPGIFAVGTFLTGTVGSLLLNIGVSAALSALSRPSAPSIEAARVNTRLNDAPRWQAGGSCLIGGELGCFAEYDEAGQLWYIVTHADCELESDPIYFLDGIEVALDVDGYVTTDQFCSKERDDQYDGTGTKTLNWQIFTVSPDASSPYGIKPTAFTDAFPDLPEDFFLTGVSYSIIKGRAVPLANYGKVYRFRGALGLGEPSVTVYGNFSRMYDPREIGHDINDPDTWTFSDGNPEIIWAWFRTNSRGRDRPMSEINWTEVAARADTFDATVLDRSGSPIPRYRCGVAFPDNKPRHECEREILNTFAGFVAYDDEGRAYANGGVYEAPTLTFTAERDIITAETQVIDDGEVAIDGVIVEYLSPEHGYTKQPAAPWQNPNYYDGVSEPNYQKITIAGCQNHNQAVRLAKNFGLRSAPTKRAAFGTSIKGILAKNKRNVNIEWDDTFTGDFEIITDVEEDASGQACAFAAVPMQADRFDLGEGEEGPPPAPTPILDIDNTLEIAANVTVAAVPVQTSVGAAVRFAASFDAPSRPDRVFRFRYALTGQTVYEYFTVDMEELLAHSAIVPDGATFDVQWQTVAGGGRATEWAADVGGGETVLTIQAIADDSPVGDLTGVTMTAEPGRVRATGTASSDANHIGVRIYRSDTTDFADAVPISSVLDGNPSDDFDVIAGDATAVNEVENGGFDDGSAWTLGGGWSIGSGVASDTAASGVEDSMTQAVSGIAVGTELRVSMVITGSSGGTVLVRLEGDTDVDMGANSDQAKGRLKVAPDNLTAVSVVSDAGWAGNVDNVFVVRETAASVELDQGYFWVVPIAISGVAGTPDGPHDLFVP
jgi:hypothetical protein